MMTPYYPIPRSCDHFKAPVSLWPFEPMHCRIVTTRIDPGISMHDIETGERQR